MPIILGQHVDSDTELTMANEKLTKHMAVFGASGSGKTGAVLGIVEDLVKDDVPVILVDVKGDMANIALSELREKMNIRLITPGATHGETVNVFAGLTNPDRITNSVTNFLKMLGEKDVDPMQSKMHAYLSRILHYMNSHGIPCEIETLIEKIIDPPFATFGALDLNTAIKRTSRLALAAKLNTLLMAPSFENWRTGGGIDVDNLYQNDIPGKTNVTIYSISHLIDDEQRVFALTLLLDEVVGWTRRQSGSDTLRASLVIDECAGFLPPLEKPTTKYPIMVLLKQARALGLGCILATQNAADLDYKAIGNCDTWLVGRLAMRRDRERVIAGLMANWKGDQKGLEYLIAALKEREFIISRPGKVFYVKSKDVMCRLRGPLTAMEMESLV